MTINNTPTQLIDANGQVSFGYFDASVRQINGREHHYITAMGKPAGRFLRHFHYKQFQYFGVINDQYLIGCAFADTAWLGLIFVYVYDVHKQQLHEWNWHSPLARRLTLSQSPCQGKSQFQSGATCITMHYDETPSGLIKSLDIQTPELQLSASIAENYTRPMSLCTPTGINGFTYANKVAGLPVKGELTFEGKTVSLQALNAFGHHDFSAGYMRRETHWNWACTSGEVEGQMLGFNLSSGVNESRYRENCYWIDQTLVPLDGICFDYQRNDLQAPWRITDTNGVIDLRFQPQGCHRERLNLGVFASNFHQIFGTFEGTIQHDGKKIALSSLYGFVEEQYAKW